MDNVNSLDARYQNKDKKLIKNGYLGYGSMSQGNSIVSTDSFWNFVGSPTKKISAAHFSFRSSCTISAQNIYTLHEDFS